MNKIETAKLCIKHAERLYSEDICPFNIERFLKLSLTEMEKQKQINSFGEKIAQACEYYLKGLTIPYMSFNNCAPMSAQENDIIINDRSQGIRKYGHSLKKLLTENSELPSTIKDQIMLELSRNLKNREVVSARHDVDKKHFEAIFPNSSDDIIEMLSRTNPRTIDYINNADELNNAIDRLVDIIENLTNENQNAYICARYGVLEGYEADIKFLWTFVKSVRSAIPLVYPNAISVKSANKYIFPDEKTPIAALTDTDEQYYEYDGSKFLCYYDEGKFLQLKEEIDGQIIIYQEDGKNTMLVKLPDISHYIECNYDSSLIPKKSKQKTLKK